MSTPNAEWPHGLTCADCATVLIAADGTTASKPWARRTRRQSAAPGEFEKVSVIVCMDCFLVADTEVIDDDA